MSYRVQLSIKALADVDQTIAWLSQHAPQAAGRWHLSLLEGIQVLESTPLLFPLAAEAGELGVDIRELLFGKRRFVYRVLYTVTDELVRILHIRHAARDWLRPEDL